MKPRHPEKVNKPINPIKKKPDWIRSKIVDSKIFFEIKKIVNQNNLVTVCQDFYDHGGYLHKGMCIL